MTEHVVERKTYPTIKYGYGDQPYPSTATYIECSCGKLKKELHSNYGSGYSLSAGNEFRMLRVEHLLGLI